MAAIEDAPFRIVRLSEEDPVLYLELPINYFPAIRKEGLVVTYAPLQASLRRELSKVLCDWIQPTTNAMTAHPFAQLHDEMKARGATDKEVAKAWLKSRSQEIQKKLRADRGGENGAIQHLIRRCTNLRRKRKGKLYNAIVKAIDAVTPGDCQNGFRNARYIPQ